MPEYQTCARGLPRFARNDRKEALADEKEALDDGTEARNDGKVARLGNSLISHFPLA